METEKLTLIKKTLPLLLLTPMLLGCGGSPVSSSSNNVSSKEEVSTKEESRSKEESSSKESSASSSEAALSYSEKEVNVNYIENTLNYKQKLRFYSSNKDVPYISIDDYYALLLKAATKEEKYKLDISHSGDTYTVTSPEGKATFDTKENTLSSDNLAFFISTKTYESGYNAMMGTDGMPWIKVGEIVPDKEPSKTIIDFDDYSIDIHKEDNKLYFPLPTLQDLFSDTNLLTSLYNRKDIYVINGLMQDTNGFGKGVYEPCLSSDLGKDYAKYIYNELCFDYDFIVGRSTRSSLERYYDLSKGLDKALDSRPYGKKAKEYLLDGTALGFATGMSMLDIILNDGGHTHFNPFQSYDYDPEAESPVAPSWYYLLYPKVNENIDILRKEGYEEVDNATVFYAHQSEMRANRKEMLGTTQETLNAIRGEDTYLKKGNTAFILIDDFMGDYYLQKEWKSYYSGEGAFPYGKNKGGAVACIYKGLSKAQEDKDIENVIVDLSSNMGGSLDEMMYLISLLTENSVGETYANVSTKMTGQKFKTSFIVDRNLDGKFDEKDKELNLVKGKNIALLMSQNGFSCGGISPIYLHDRGIFTMGDISGGGSCSIINQHLMTGLSSRFSSSDAMLDKNGNNIDTVRENSCDYKFEIKSRVEEGKTVYDYSEFFKMENIETALKSHFK